jgi:hypothetical protein
MKVFITGGTGFIGCCLSDHLLSEGHQVTVVGRSSRQNCIDYPNFTYIPADTTRPGKWMEQLTDTEVAINLTGKSIFTLWNDKAKKAIYDSRILTTRNLVTALPENMTLLSTSAVGYYGDHGDKILSEDQLPGNDFLARVCRDWEKEALKATQKGVRVSVMRFGIVLGRGGALEKMIPAFKSFLGGRLGNGNQWFPWIHIQDLISAVLFLFHNSRIEGPVNICAPYPVRNKELTKILAGILNRPALFRMPAVAMRLIMGEFGETLLKSTRAVPVKLQNEGFRFNYPDLNTAVSQIIGET